MADFIREFWDSQAKKHGGSHAASWGDNFAVDLEIETIGKYIPRESEVLDVGCANGHATLRHHRARKVRSITGVDFSEAMIREAERSKAAQGAPDNVSFEVGDVRSLRFDKESFDVVYTTRTLINLPTWNEQQQGILECVRVCRRGGTIVFSEAFWEPLVLLNSLRTLVSLPPLVEHDFNRYLKRSYLEKFLTSLGLGFDAVDFCSIYYLGSRFLRELVTKPTDYPGYSNPINGIFYKMERKYSGGGFGIQQAYVVRKT